MKSEVTYKSNNNDRQWKKEGGRIFTRIASDIWRPANQYPQPYMSEPDIDYYIRKGEIYEA